MAEMNRWSPTQLMEPDPGGAWIKLEDHEGNVAALKQLLKAWMELQYVDVSDPRHTQLNIRTIAALGGGFIETGGAFAALSSAPPPNPNPPGPIDPPRPPRDRWVR